MSPPQCRPSLRYVLVTVQIRPRLVQPYPSSVLRPPALSTRNVEGTYCRLSSVLWQYDEVGARHGTNPPPPAPQALPGIDGSTR
eukprot:485394-Rhodomonas_salina.1